MNKLDIRSYDIYYQMLLALVSQGILDSKKMSSILEFLDNIDADLERIIVLKNSIQGVNFSYYKNTIKSLIALIKEHPVTNH